MNKEKQASLIDRFFNLEYRKLINYVRKNLDDRYTDAEPEDIVQDVAIGLISRLDVNAQIENISGYIYRSLKNKIIDLSRRKKNDISHERIENAEISGGHVLNEAFKQDNFDVEVLYEALDLLDSIDREIIILNEFEKLTYQEISIKLNLPVGTLLSRKHRALSRLYKIITEIKMNNDY
jgi:RNA polymerase sigma-70 factor (ECF subfamily)